MKKNLLVITLLLLATNLFLTSCEDKTDPETSIVGTWVFQSQKMKVNVSGVENLPSIPSIGNIGDLVKEFEQDTTIYPPEGEEQTREFQSNDSLIIKVNSIISSKTTYQRSGNTLTIDEGGVESPYDITTLDNAGLRYQFVKSMTVIEAIDFAVSQGLLDATKAAELKRLIPLLGELLNNVKINTEIVFTFTKK